MNTGLVGTWEKGGSLSCFSSVLGDIPVYNTIPALLLIPIIVLLEHHLVCHLTFRRAVWKHLGLRRSLLRLIRLLPLAMLHATAMNIDTISRRDGESYAVD